jgi:hypothetical protein
LVPLLVEPSLKLGGIRSVKPPKKLAGVELQRLSVGASGSESLELARIAPQRRRIEAHLLVGAGDDETGAERQAQVVKRLAQSGAGVRLIEVGPEQGNERVSAMKPALIIHGEEREQRQSLRLTRGTESLLPGRPTQLNGTEGPQGKHGGAA